jgi:hypothetical protein
MDEQDIESAQRDGVQGEEIGGQQPGGLGMQEAAPPGVCSAWRRPEAGGGQDPADRFRAQAVSEPDEFTLDAAVAPGRILLRQVHHEVTDLVTDRWAAGPVRVGPLFRDQAAVPAQQRGWGNETMQTQLRGDQPSQGGQDRSVWPGRTRSTDLTTQHRDLMAQDEDLDVPGSGAAGEQPKPAEHRDTDQIQQSE